MPPPEPPHRSPAPPYPIASEVPVEPPPRQPEEWDTVDEASWESFPASDPPSFTPEHAVADAPAVTSAPMRRSRADRRARLLGLAGITIAFAAGFATGYRVRRARPDRA